MEQKLRRHRITVLLQEKMWYKFILCKMILQALICIFVLFNNTFNRLQYKTWNDTKKVKNELEILRKETAKT